MIDSCVILKIRNSLGLKMTAKAKSSGVWLVDCMKMEAELRTLRNYFNPQSEFPSWRRELDAVIECQRLFQKIVEDSGVLQASFNTFLRAKDDSKETGA
jgi:hypothetical protein